MFLCTSFWDGCLFVLSIIIIFGMVTYVLSPWKKNSNGGNDEVGKE